MSVEEREMMDENRLIELQDDTFLGSNVSRELQRRTLINDELRSYEVSLWTLQDEFITVLKWSDAAQKNRIQNPKLVLDVDGTQEFSFKIPMYINDSDILTSIITYQENPIWYNTQNGNLIEGMRKIKVIFNKDQFDPDEITDWEEVFRKAYVPANYHGNADLMHRYIVPASTFIAQGWTEFDGTYGTLYSQSNSFSIGNKTFDIIYTPIANDGSLLTPEGVNQYLLQKLAAADTVEGLMAADRNDKCLFLAIEEETPSHYSLWCEDLHNRQAEWDNIRAHHNWFGKNRNPANVSFDYEVSYHYYEQYLCSQHIFEFVITKVKETHSGDIPMCEVSCESLAFHELGKLGYKYSLSADTCELDMRNWQEKGYWYKEDGTQVFTEPRNTLQYWCEKCGIYPIDTSNKSSNAWYYDVRMNWNYSEGNRSPAKIYEDAYTSSWSTTLEPLSVTPQQEKMRIVKIEESNLYNITQTIAETFKIFCKYEYTYDANYQITGRTVVFFNSYIDETNALSLTYPHHSKEVSREKDSTDLITKMYVREEDTESSLYGTISITNTAANPTKEDYILDFEYMKQVGAINDEQYAEVKLFEEAVRKLNDDLEKDSYQLIALQQKKNDLDAKVTYYDNSRNTAQAQLDQAGELFTNLTNSDGTNDGRISRTNANPHITYIKSAQGGTMITMHQQEKGIVEETIKVYGGYDPATQKLNDPINIISYVRDPDFNDITDVFIDGSAYVNSNKPIYVTYDYIPKLYVQAVVDRWTSKCNQADIDYQAAVQAQKDNNDDLEDISNRYDATLNNKKTLLKKFETIMGPALREGYWQPENYQDYGEHKDVSTTLSFAEIFNSFTNYPSTLATDIVVGWDRDLFKDTESELYYEEGMLQTRHYYPFIDLSITPQVAAIVRSALQGRIADDGTINETKIDIVFRSPNYATLNLPNPDSIEYLKIFTVDGKNAELGFVKVGNRVVPAIILIGTETMTVEDIKFLCDAEKSHPRIGTLKPQPSGNTITYTIENSYNLSSADIVWPEESQTIMDRVYPRIKISSPAVNPNTISVYAHDKLLKNYDDYSIANRTTLYTNNYAILECYITLKPKALLCASTTPYPLRCQYTLSTAETFVYLDAKKGIEENAKPKVTYTITPNVLDYNLIEYMYTTLARMILINDTDLKLENAFGYISHLELDLDQPQNDSIEIKNYKTKFEDLFSTIVAQTEDMKRSGVGVAAAINGNIDMGADAFASTLANNSSIMDAYLNSYFDSSDVVKERLASIFSEAGQILADSNSALNNLHALTVKNASILSGFVSNIAAELTPKIHNSQTKPVNFKTGDIWNQLDSAGNIIGRYLATSDSNDAAGGFTRTYDGSLAAITGADIKIDAAAGTIDILAENKIDMKSGGNIYIAANENVDIVGNKAINLGGTRINMATFSNSKQEEGGITLVASQSSTGDAQTHLITKLLDLIDPYADIKVNNQILEIYQNTNFRNRVRPLVKASANNGVTNYYLDLEGGDQLELSAINALPTSNSGDAYYETIVNAIRNKISTYSFTSKVSIKPTKIEMASANILMRGANTIQMVTSTNSLTNTSALSISPSDGIWIGSGKGLTLYAGNVNVVKNNGIYTITGGSGASVELVPSHLLFGVSETGNSTVVEIKKDYLIIGSASQLNNSTFNNKALTGKGGLIGAKFSNDTIGFATQTDNTVNAFLMNDNGVIIASDQGNGINLATSNSDEIKNYFKTTSNGSYTRVSANGIELGSLADLYINTNNFKLQTNANANGLGTTIFAIGANLQNINSNTTTANNKFYNGNTEVSADVNLLLNQNGLYVKGTVYATAGKFTGAVEASSFVAVSNGKGKLLADALHLGFYDTSDQPIMTLNSGAMTVAGSFNFTADNLLINSNPQQGEAYFRLGLSTDAQLEYTSSGLTVKGAITATSFTVVGNALSDIRSAAGLGTQAWGNRWPQGQRADGTPMTYLTLNSADIDGGILLTTGNGIVVPWVAPPGTPQAAAEAVQNFETPALIMNTTGFQYRYMPVIASDSTYRPTDDIAQGAANISINKDGVTLSGSNISVNSGEITINGTSVAKYLNIICSVTEPTEHPENNWVWIKPISQSISSRTITFNNFDQVRTAVQYNEISGLDSSQWGSSTAAINYTITCVIKFSSDPTEVFNGGFKLNVQFITYDSSDNVINSGSCSKNIDFGGIYPADIGTTRTRSETINIPNILTSNVYKIKVILTGNRAPYYPQTVTLTADILDSNVNSNTAIPCEVYYYP